jgi:hypothetical protein
MLPAALQAQTVQVRFLDSATGCAIQPETLTTRRCQAGAVERRVLTWQISKAGRTALSLERGRHTLLAVSPRHKPMSAELDASENQSYILQFMLDPLEEPRELQPDYLAGLQRDDATLIQGFVVYDDTAEPLDGVQVSSAPSGVQAQTDGRGFFQLYVPVQNEAETQAAPANASLGAGTGVSRWPTTDTNAGNTNPVTVRVTDNGAPPMIDTKRFAVTVLARPSIQSITCSSTNATLTWSAIPGTEYRVQFKHDLNDTNWTDLVPDVTAAGPVASITDTPNVQQRFYRSLALN